VILGAPTRHEDFETMPWESTALQQEFPADMASDRRLVRLVERHLAQVWRTLRRLGLDEGESDDAAQQVMLLAARRLGDIEPHRERAFVMATAVRVAAGARRKRERRREVMDDDLVGRLAENDHSPEDLLARRQARELLDTVLGELPLELATVLVLFEIEELSLLEIGGTLGLKLGTVASRLRRARAEFDRHIKRWEARSRHRGGAR
jgi:RNA polymerase sigma-70 factor, ECF subfamily